MCSLNNDKENSYISLAILGAGRIGKIHARIFHELGTKIIAVLGSTDASSKEAAENLEVMLNCQIRPFSNIDKMLQCVAPDAVTICTPPHLHYEQMLKFFDRGIPVFCEKPMFWHPNITYSEVEKKLNFIKLNPNRKLFVNTSNASFIDIIYRRLPSFDDIKEFSIKFYTQGKYRGKDIACDLLPHAFSLLIKLFGGMDIFDFQFKITSNFYICNFFYGKCFVKIEFSESDKNEKEFTIRINNKEFTRMQENSSGVYKIFLMDKSSNEKIEVIDPFVVYIRHFINFCKTDDRIKIDNFNIDAANMRLMSNILLR